MKTPGGEPTEGARGTVVPCVVWGWEGHGIDEGPEASEWFSRFCGREVRLLRVDAGGDRLGVGPTVGVMVEMPFCGVFIL